MGGREDGAAGRLQWIGLKRRQVIVGRRIRDTLSRFVRQATGQGEGRMLPEAKLAMGAHGGPGGGHQVAALTHHGTVYRVIVKQALSLRQ